MNPTSHDARQFTQGRVFGCFDQQSVEILETRRRARGFLNRPGKAHGRRIPCGPSSVRQVRGNRPPTRPSPVPSRCNWARPLWRHSNSSRTLCRRRSWRAARPVSPSALNEWHETSIALPKPSAEQFSSPPCRSSFGAKAMEWNHDVLGCPSDRVWCRTPPPTGPVSRHRAAPESPPPVRSPRARRKVWPSALRCGHRQFSRRLWRNALAHLERDRAVVGDSNHQRALSGKHRVDGLVKGFGPAMQLLMPPSLQARAAP